MKKAIAVILSIALALTMLVGCGGAKENTKNTKDNGNSSTKTESPKEEKKDDGTSADNTTKTAEDTTAANPIPDWTAYEQLIKDIKSCADYTKREELMHQAEDMLMETNAVIPIYYYNDIYMVKSAIKEIRTTVTGNKYFMYATGTDGTLNACIASEPDHLDPALNSSVDGAILASNSFVGLYTYDADGKVVPALADSVDVSDDELSYTFHLKSGLKWSDGSDLTAKDFEYSWKRAAAKKTAADYGYLYDGFARGEDGDLDVKAVDDNTLTCKLTAPCAYFLELMAFPTFLPVQQKAVEAPKDHEENPGSWAQEAGFVSNGAYTLKEWKHEESMVYVANPYYYDAKNVTVKELHFMLSSDDTAIYAAYNAGDLDFIDTVPTDEIASLLNNSEFHIEDQIGTYYVAFNVKSKLFEGKTVQQANDIRKAFSLLIDRQYITENIGQTGQKVATSFIPPKMLDGHGGEFKTNDDAYTFPDKETMGYFTDTYSDDCLTQAVELLKSAGYEFDDNNMLSSSTPISLTYLTNTTTGHVKIAEAIQQDLAAVGITLNIQQEEWNVFLNDRKSGNFDFAREGWTADFNDPINMLEMWTADSGNNDCQFGR